MKAKFVVEATELENGYRVTINGKRTLQLQSTSLHDLVFFMVTQAVTYALDDYVEVFSRGGGTGYIEFIPNVYEDEK